MTISEWKQAESLRREREEIKKKALLFKLADDEEALIDFSNMIGEKYAHLPNFEKADEYLTVAIQKKMGEINGYLDEPDVIIENTLRILGINTKCF